MKQRKRNPAFGKWTEKETNWSDADTAFLENTTKGGDVKCSYADIIKLHESLPY